MNILRNPVLKKRIDILILIGSLDHIPPLLPNPPNSWKYTESFRIACKEMIRLTPLIVLILEKSGGFHERIETDESTSPANPRTAVHNNRAWLLNPFLKMPAPAVFNLTQQVENFLLHFRRSRGRFVIFPVQFVQVSQLHALSRNCVCYLQVSLP